MKQWFFILILASAFSKVSFSCCAEYEYRLFPIGEWNDEVVFIEFSFSRNCEMGIQDHPEENEFWFAGTINLKKSSGDSLTLIENIDTIRFVNCLATYSNHYRKSNYETLVAPFYKKGLDRMNQLSSFKKAKTKSIQFNDLQNTIITNEETDSTYSHSLAYKDFFTTNFDDVEIISSYPDKVAEVRIYETSNYEITVLRLRCQLLSDEAIARNEKRFKKLETAFWKESAQWHGIAKDYYLIRKK